MSRKNDKRVSRGGPQDDVFVEKNDSDVGAYTVQPLAGLMGMSGSDFIAPGAGVASNFIGTWLTSKVLPMIPIDVSRFTPVIGGVLGAVLAGVAVPFVAGKSKKIALQAGAISLTMGIANQVLRETGGLGAVVLNRIAGAPSMGMLPAVTGGGSMPRQIKTQMDKGVYGRTWS